MVESARSQGCLHRSLPGRSCTGLLERFAQTHPVLLLSSCLRPFRVLHLILVVVHVTGIVILCILRLIGQPSFLTSPCTQTRTLIPAIQWWPFDRQRCLLVLLILRHTTPCHVLLVRLVFCFHTSPISLVLRSCKTYGLFIRSAFDSQLRSATVPGLSASIFSVLVLCFVTSSFFYWLVWTATKIAACPVPFLVIQRHRIQSQQWADSIT
jgi:hypothetical protein